VRLTPFWVLFAAAEEIHGYPAAPVDMSPVRRKPGEDAVAQRTRSEPGKCEYNGSGRCDQRRPPGAIWRGGGGGPDVQPRASTLARFEQLAQRICMSVSRAKEMVAKAMGGTFIEAKELFWASFEGWNQRPELIPRRMVR